MRASSLREKGYASTRGSFDEQTLPWRLHQKAKRLMWDPAEIDFSQDVRDWESLDEIERKTIARLATMFMTGEEAVTVDILPLVRAMADMGRFEDTLFLTTFAFEEGRHTEFFRRWFDAVGFDGSTAELVKPAYSRLFDDEQPRVMRRLDTDRSPEALLDAALTYNHFVEGVLALTGYRAWHEIFTDRGVLPGMREGLEGVQRDERRHIAYGTWLCRRLIAADPDLWGFVERRMGELQTLGMELISELGDDLIAEAEASGGAGQYLSGQTPEEVLQDYAAYALTQFSRRMEAMEVARRASVEEVEASNVEEELEDELAGL